MLHRTTIAAMLFGLLINGCGSGAGEPVVTEPAPPLDGHRSSAHASSGNASVSSPTYSSPMPTDLNSMIQAALTDAANTTRLDVSALKIVSAEKVTWRDGSLGCPAPGRMYTMALVPGYRIRIQAGAELLDYHAGARGQPVACPPGRATEPVADARI